MKLTKQAQMAVVLTVVLCGTGLLAWAADMEAVLDTTNGTSGFVVRDAASNQLLRVKSDGTAVLTGPLSAVLRGDLYLDGATGVYYRAIFGSGPWNNLLAGYATGTPVYVESDPLWAAASNGVVSRIHDLEVTKGCFFPAHSDGGGVTELYGSYSTVRVMPLASTYFTFRIPDDMGSISNLALLGIPALGSGTDIHLNSCYAQAGEAYNAHSNTVGVSFSPVPENMAEISITSAFPNVSAGDICGLQVSHPPGSGADVRYVGIVLRYSGRQ